MTDRLPVKVMNEGDVGEAIIWADREGWEPGLDDAAAFHAADPGGFFRSVEGDRTVAMMSAVRSSAGVTFVGLFIVDPARRGEGFGKALWDQVLAGTEGTTLGLDAVPDQAANYATAGFKPAHGNARYSAEELPAGASPTSEVHPATDVDFDSLTAFDGRHFFGDRPEFLRRWIGGPGRNALVTTDEAGEITGFAASRRSSRGHRIGPVFADGPDLARDLILALASSSDGWFAVDVPLTNGPAIDLLESLGMERSFETVRMYRGTAPELPLDRIFGLTSLELG